MARFRGERDAFGRPGLEPRWTHAGKDGVGTAYAISSRIWFTLLGGVLTEIYYPTVDRAQVRDLQYLITAGSTVFDMVNSVTGLIAAGNTESPRRALSYLAASQQEDGGFAQNFWINGDPYWTGIQLDEVAFPILLACRLARDNVSIDR
jgi:GH15 family glucan-1,4-alpha-glucosidase